MTRRIFVDTLLVVHRRTSKPREIRPRHSTMPGPVNKPLSTVSTWSGPGRQHLLITVDGDELNFQNPTLAEDSVTITQPKMLMAQLKEYQLKGLTWLGNLYEQGINGILADEMGLGKTIQSISLLAYLAEHHNLWGPFLVIAPASTLHNWQQELARFVPRLKALPYWGSPKDRETLRKIWNKKNMTFDESSPFHILVTSYQLVSVLSFCPSSSDTDCRLCSTRSTSRVCDGSI